MHLKRSFLAATMLAFGLASVSTPAQAAPEPFLGQIMPTGFTFCPRGWAQASGQILAISQNTALFALLGTTFGGNGQTTFALPNLNGRMPVHVGQGPGLPNYVDGEVFGTETIQLTAANLPSHSHTARLRAQSGAGDSNQPTRNSLAAAPAGTDIYSTATAGADMRAGNVNLLPTGQGQAIANRTPALAIKYCIALQGIFPPRN